MVKTAEQQNIVKIEKVSDFELELLPFPIRPLGHPLLLFIEQQSVTSEEYVRKTVVDQWPASTQVTTASSGVIGIIDYVNLFKALPAGYKTDFLNKLVFLMHPDTHATYMLEQFEANARTMITPKKIFGVDIALCPSLPTVSAGQSNAVILCHRDYIRRRDVAGASVKRYVQNGGIEYGLAEYQGFARFDFAPVLFGSHVPPVASLNIHS